MPYIKQDQRKDVDPLIQPLIDHVKTLPVEEQDGALNYAVTRVLKAVYPTKYFHLNRALGLLTAISAEFYRKVVAPYEETKITEHGDV